MSDIRDTKFIGFAELLMVELGLDFDDEGSKLTIAQRAYDLVKHVLDEAPITEYEWDIHTATDLTEWPK